MTKDAVRAYYANFGEREWQRLTNPDDGAVEFALTKEILAHYLPSFGRILDLGGGPGRYTIWLAQRGYQSDARFAQAETKYGLFPSGGALLRLPAPLLREMVFTAAPIDATRAVQHGLVQHVVAPGESLAAALELASVIAANPPGGVLAAKILGSS